MIKAYIQLIIFSSEKIELIQPASLERLNQEIVQNALISNILIMAINCIENHFHFLIYLNEKQTIDNISEQLKNITVVKLKEKNFVEADFIWEDEYLALSISPLFVEKERHLINQQQLLHLERSLSDEIDLLLSEGEEKYLSLITSDIMTEKE